MKKDPNVKYHCDKACPNNMNIQCIRCFTVLSALLKFFLKLSSGKLPILALRTLIFTISIV